MLRGLLDDELSSYPLVTEPEFHNLTPSHCSYIAASYTLDIVTVGVYPYQQNPFTFKAYSD
jgi:hypothetical protein